MLTIEFKVNLTNLRENGKAVFEKAIDCEARHWLAVEQREMMQAHYGLSEAKQKEKQQEFNARFLSKILVTVPTNLPGFVDPKTQAQDGSSADPPTTEATLFEYLNEKTEAKEALAQAMMDAHFEATNNRYYFR